MNESKFHLITSKKGSKLCTRVISRQLQSPFRSSLARTINPHMRSLSRNYKKSPLKGRVSPERCTPIDKNLFKTDLSISTAASIKSRIQEEDQNIIKTPTTIQEEPPLTESLEADLNNYFNKYSFIQTSQVPKVRHRYTHTTDFTPIRSETPEIPTRQTKEEKLPVIKKIFKKNRSPSPYELRSKSRNRRKSPQRP